jgi:LacI family transcriptional regulator
MEKRISLKDIARHVGVSTALVSYVLNDKAEEMRVGTDIAEKIRATALQLNYSPNHIAKSLRTNVTHTIGLIVADINYRFTTGVTSAIEAEAKKKNYTVIFGSSDENSAKFSELVNVLVSRQVDGLILVPVENSEAQIKQLLQRKIPFVLIDRYFPGVEANLIAIDNFKAAYEAVKYLTRSDHRRIGFINYRSSLFHLQERNRGYVQALKDSKSKTSNEYLKSIREKHLKEDLPAAINDLVSPPLSCDAIFFATDTLAINGLKHINSLKLKIPNDLSVLSFDEAEAFELFYCSITYNKQPLEEIGKLAVDTLIDLINDNKIITKVFLESNFVVGKSCGEK